MRKVVSIITLAFFTLFGSQVFAQVTIGALMPPDSSAVLQIIAPNNDKGVLFPKLTTAQRDAIKSPINGLMIFNTDNRSINFYCDSIGGWKSFGHADVTESQRDKIINAPVGETIFNTSNQCIEVWNGSKWISFSSAPYKGTAPVNVDTINRVISVATGNIATGASLNTSGSAITIVGAGQLLTGNSTFSVHNTAPLWNANQLLGNAMAPGQFAPVVGQVLKWTSSGWAPGADNTGAGYSPTAPITIDGSNRIGISTAPPVSTINSQLTVSGGVAGQVLTSSGPTSSAGWQPIPAWLLGGNASTTPETNFIGTTDNNDLVFKRYSTNAGRIGASNISFGLNALTNNVGTDNVAIGANTLTSNAYSASGNTAIGANALISSTTGGYNTAVGESALYSNQTNIYNTGVGSWSLYLLSTGNYNMGFGMNAGAGLTSGDNNVFIGANSGVANNSLTDNGTLKTGSNNIIIGYSATASSDNKSNEITIGAFSPPPLAATQTARVNAATWTYASDRRLKRDIKPLSQGLDFVAKLQPVEFVYNNLSEKVLGFIAQDVKDAMDKENMNGYGLVPTLQGDLLGLNTTELIPILTKAIQEQQEIINTQQQSIDALVRRIEALEKN